MSSVKYRRNILQLIRDRELNDNIRTKHALKSNLNYKCISQLGLFGILEGHQGCVNCLQWNESGSTLASASDDYQVILWDPFLQKVKTSIKTLHQGNIFTVKFLPSSNDEVVATGAGDWSSRTHNVITGKQINSCLCSQGRIKRIAVANDTPNVYWSASEDGCIRQHDLRVSHACPHDKSKITLVSIYGNLGTTIEAKCIDINQLRTEQLAVGANDPYVRLYDRRMIRSLSSFTIKYPYPKNPSKYVFEYDGPKTEFNKMNNVPDGAVQYFVPGHIHLNAPIIPNKHKNIGVTYLTFSSDGQELLVNYGGEYVYLYDIMNRADSAFFDIPKVMKVPRENGEGSSIDTIDDSVPVPHLALPHKVEQLKLKANYLFEKAEYTLAIKAYNEAIHIHKCSVLFSNRAAAYIKRKWHGDVYAALKDCVTALKLDPNHMKAHFRLAVCLYELGKLKDSKIYLDQFTTKYPSYKTSVAYKCLNYDLSNALHKNKDESDEKNLLGSSGTVTNTAEAIQSTQTQSMTLEKYFRNQTKDYHHRYYGHCNTSTDIKEANFFGNNNQFIVAGSDDGLFFVWDKQTENNLLILKGDGSIVNCLQPHPSQFMLATSGIDNEVKIWTPFPDGMNNVFVVDHYSTTATINQRRMMADPFEVIIRSMRSTVQQMGLVNVEEQYGTDPLSEEFSACRTS